MASTAAEFWTGRRAAISAALAMLGAAPLAKAGPDAEQVRLSARLVEIERAVDAYPGDIDENSPAGILELLDQHDSAMQAMLHVRAETVEGYRAKARAVNAMLPSAWAGDYPSDPRMLVRSLLDDLLFGRGDYPAA